MKSHLESTQNARRARVREISALSRSQGLHDGGFLLDTSWKDYYLKALEGAPLACYLCVSIASSAYNEIRKGYSWPSLKPIHPSTVTLEGDTIRTR